MPLPELIEIVPITKPAHTRITVPGSKSITNRALILAALADGDTTLRGALWSEDTQIMVDGKKSDLNSLKAGTEVSLTLKHDDPNAAAKIETAAGHEGASKDQGKNQSKEQNKDQSKGQGK